MNFEQLVPNVYYSNISHGLKMFVDCLGFVIGHNEINAEMCIRDRRYGWGVHYDQDGKMAIFGAESAEYKKLSKDKSLQVIKAMKSKK